MPVIFHWIWQAFNRNLVCYLVTLPNIEGSRFLTTIVGYEKWALQHDWLTYFWMFFQEISTTYLQGSSKAMSMQAKFATLLLQPASAATMTQQVERDPHHLQVVSSILTCGTLILSLIAFLNCTSGQVNQFFSIVNMQLLVLFCLIKAICHMCFDPLVSGSTHLYVICMSSQTQKKLALAGNRTQAACVEGNHFHH